MYTLILTFKGADTKEHVFSLSGLQEKATQEYALALAETLQAGIIGANEFNWYEEMQGAISRSVQDEVLI